MIVRELLQLTDIELFMFSMFVSIWLIALTGTVIEFIRRRKKAKIVSQCDHTFTSNLSSTSELICYKCGDIKPTSKELI